MAMRNWWLNAQIDGRAKDVVGGPQRKDGGFTMEIRQRVKGGSVVMLTIDGRVHAETGDLWLSAYDATTGESLRVWMTER